VILSMHRAPQPIIVAVQASYRWCIQFDVIIDFPEPTLVGIHKDNYLDEIKRYWHILFAAFVAVGVGVTALPFYTAGLFMRSLEAEFDWSRSMSAGGGLAVSIGAAIAAPVVGRLLDFFGTRKVALISMLCVVAGYFFLSVMKGSFVFF